MHKPQTSYHWHDERSVIRQMDVFVDKEGAKHVNLLHAVNAPPQQLATIPDILEKNGIKNSYLSLQANSTALHIRNIENETHVLQVLQQSGIAVGTVQKEAHPDTPVEKLPLMDKVKRHAMNYFGYLGMTGHFGVMMTGLLQKDPRRMQQGMISLVQPSLMARYGNGKNEIDFEHMYDKMRDFYADEGYELPRFNNVEQQQRFLSSVNRFVSDNVISIGYGLSVLSNIRGLQSSVRQGLDEKTVGSWMRTGNNGLNLTGNMITMTVPETKKTAQEHKAEHEKSLPQGLWETATGMMTNPMQTVQRNPIRVDNMLKLFGNGMFFYDTADEYDKINRRWLKNIESKPFKGALKTLQDEANKLGHHINAQAISGNTINTEELMKTLNTINNKGVLTKSGQTVQQMIRQHEIASSLRGKLSVAFVGVSATTFLAATLVAGLMGSKNRDPSLMTDEVYDQMYGLGAQTLIKLPEEMRGPAARKMASYLATQPDVHDAGISAEQIEEEFVKRVVLFEQSPWVQGAHMQKQNTASEPVNTQQEQAEHAALHQLLPKSVIASHSAKEASTLADPSVEQNTYTTLNV